MPLQEELEFLQKYLEIEQTRFQDRLTVTFEIDPETLDAEVPRLILQPLVENAIKHGIAPRSGPGTVQISSRRDGDAPVARGARQRRRPDRRRARELHGGVGLSNTRARLECLYGDTHRLEFSEGAAASPSQMRIPFHRARPSGTDDGRVPRGMTRQHCRPRRAS